MTGQNADQPIRLLHLSDVHFSEGKRWDADPVLWALAGFIRNQVGAGLAPDLVVITGDLAFSGKPEEYALAREWLERELWPALTLNPTEPLPRDRLLLVPGNHDVDRTAVDFVAEATQSALLSRRDQDQIAKVLSQESQRGVLLARHAAYATFYSDWLGQVQPLPWWQRTIEVRGEHTSTAPGSTPPGWPTAIRTGVTCSSAATRSTKR